VERLKCRVLVVWGEEDPFQPIRYGERLAAALPNATLVTVAGARHFLPEDHGEELARLILDWSRL
ncbi:MAG: alpha/beta hydrolase, partial [Actinomadura rubrobrunea]|nr:alpha/beta hydrolase [Actinomadura rubrobrunea]